MIELKNVEKSYRLNKANAIRVLKNVSIAFERKEFVAILGPSGCGKTSLLNIIGGLDRCDSGEVIVEGVSTKDYSVSDWDNYRNKKIGFVFQSYNLIPHLSVVRNVEMPLVLAGAKASESRRRALAALKSLGLEDQAHKKPAQLSGGQMQRVALARALAVEPDAILADEPTGALDRESGTQIMTLLAKVAEERLVVMVTHNTELAKRYSTRIIDLTGGEVSEDSRIPKNVAAEPRSGEKNPSAERAEADEGKSASDGVVAVDEPQGREANVPLGATDGSNLGAAREKTVASRLGAKKRAAREKKPHLTFAMACDFSGRTLLNKKIRTALTSFAGSIGIIGIILVLAIATGVNGYISNLEKGSLSAYPLIIERSSLNIASLIEKLTYSDSERADYPDGDTLYVNKILGNLLTEMFSLSRDNDLRALKEHLDANLPDKCGRVRYDFGVPMHVYAKDPKKPDVCMKTNPFTDVMDKTMIGKSPLMDGIHDKIIPFAEKMSAWSELSDNDALLKSQYELIGDSAWPKREPYRDENGDFVTEVLMVTDKKNQLNDYALFMLGLKSEDDVADAILGKSDFSTSTFSIGEIKKKEYFILGGYDYYEKQGDGTFVRWDATVQTASFVERNFSIKAKVVGAMRPRKGAPDAIMQGAIAYRGSLTRFLMRRALESEAVLAQLADEMRIFDGEKLAGRKDIASNKTLTESDYAKRLKEMGVADETDPIRIEIFANSFEDKEKIAAFLKDYNKTHPKTPIKYADTLKTMMSFVNALSNAISRTLVGFTSISLIVSSIMIAVIIYTSVLERRKEVGILRSIGARKKDVAMLFIAESGILGLGAGLLGVFVGWLLTLPINALLLRHVGIPSLAIVKWWHAVAMVAISFALSVAAGVMPAELAARQDPAEALRTD